MIIWARYTAVEIGRKRLVQMAVLGALVYGTVLWWFLGQVYSGLGGSYGGPGGGFGGTLDTAALAQASALGIGLFIDYGLVALFAAFATAGALSADRELLGLMVRPLSRRTMVWGRFLGYGGATVLYATLVFWIAVAATALRFGLPANGPELVAAWGLFAGEGLAIAALTLLGSIWLSPMANGIAVLGLYFLVFLAGSINQLAHIATTAFGSGNPGALVFTTSIANFVCPSDALYRWALFEALGSIRASIPLPILGPLGAGSVVSPYIALYAALYVAGIVALAERGWHRRDLH